MSHPSASYLLSFGSDTFIALIYPSGSGVAHVGGVGALKPILFAFELEGDNLLSHFIFLLFSFGKSSIAQKRLLVNRFFEKIIKKCAPVGLPTGTTFNILSTSFAAVPTSIGFSANIGAHL